MSGLSEQVVNLRSTVLRGTPYTVDMEDEQIFSVENAILEHMTRSSIECSINVRTAIDIKLLSRTVCLETAVWLRQQVTSTIDVLDW